LISVYTPLKGGIREKRGDGGLHEGEKVKSVRTLSEGVSPLPVEKGGRSLSLPLEGAL